MTDGVVLRDLTDADLSTFFEHQRDPVAHHMAAFMGRDPTDREAFTAHWAKIRSDDDVIIKTVLFDGAVAGHIAKFVMCGDPEVTYWIGREHWGKGIATAALAAFLRELDVRPLYAHAAKDNLGSLRVLEKCGFTVTGNEKAFAKARGEEIEEVVLKLA